MSWIGADPGGKRAFGIALLHDDGNFDCATVSCTDEALDWLTRKKAIGRPMGIDAPLWWSSGPGAGRRVDAWLRKRYRITAGTVQSANSLRGAALVQGMMLALRYRALAPEAPITEAHPKALLIAQGINTGDGTAIRQHYRLNQIVPTEHVRDAVLEPVMYFCDGAG
jgi:predicted nuclease with RNAse H fold